MSAGKDIIESVFNGQVVLFDKNRRLSSLLTLERPECLYEGNFGFYVMYNKETGEVGYVGSSSNLSGRINQHIYAMQKEEKMTEDMRDWVSSLDEENLGIIYFYIRGKNLNDSKEIFNEGFRTIEQRMISILKTYSPYKGANYKNPATNCYYKEKNLMRSNCVLIVCMEDLEREPMTVKAAAEYYGITKSNLYSVKHKSTWVELFSFNKMAYLNFRRA